MDQRIVFLGTPEISAYVLEGLVQNGFNIVGVVTAEDKVRGRNGKVEESPVAKVARKYKLPLHKPHRLNKEPDFVRDLNPDLLLTFAFGQILSDAVLALSKYKPLNLHGSLLPKYRGCSPMQTALLNGEEKTGVSLMEMVHEMDAGAVYAVEEIPLTKEDNYTSLCDKMQRTALKLTLEALPLYFENKLEPVNQVESEATFTKMITKEDQHLSFSVTPSEFIRRVKALSLKPGAYAMYGEEILKIYDAVEDTSDAPVGEEGEIVVARKNNLIVSVKGGNVKILSLQRPGKKIMSAADFINGMKNKGKVVLR